MTNVHDISRCKPSLGIASGTRHNRRLCRHPIELRATKIFPYKTAGYYNKIHVRIEVIMAVPISSAVFFGCDAVYFDR